MKSILNNVKLYLLTLILFFIIYLYYISNINFIEFFNLNPFVNIKQNQNIVKLKGLKYLKKCLNNTLKNNFLLPLKNLPKVSIIIPVYNCQLSIELAVRSVQNQNFYNLEIILVNDFSSDNSSRIIKNMQKYDKRIKILNNNKNMGILYSRCIGALNSKGDYIFPLDNDDVFLNEKIIRTFYKKAKKDNYDIVEFKSFEIPNYNPKIKDLKNTYFNHHPHNLILHQPELAVFPISKKNKYFANDFHLWGKCILTKIYKDAVNLLGINRYSVYNCWTEDISVIFIIFNLAKSYIFLSIYGIFHLKSRNTTTFKLKMEHVIFSEIYLLDIIFDFLKNNEESKKYAVYKAIRLNYIKKYLNKKLRKYFKYVLKKIIECQYINKENKLKLLNNFKDILNN